MNLGEIFQDDTGALSSMRVVFVLWSVGLLALWVGLSIKAGTMVPIPQQALEVMGITAGAKTVQSFSESTNNVNIHKDISVNQPH